ncbi:MAG TPA: GNAT family N-acetyltransferase [Caproicibacter sp.]|nr:GNAT family N-acetyltransferase [Caproicibacter sp.]
MRLCEMTEQNAREICGWKYADEYAVYNYPDWETLQDRKWAIADSERRRNEFYSVFSQQNNLVAYFRLVRQSDGLLLGLGMKPEYCGKGFGGAFMALIVRYAQQNFPGNNLQLDVREFNRRAIKCYEKAGFQTAERHFKKTPAVSGWFVRMVLKPDSVTDDTAGKSDLQE